MSVTRGSKTMRAQAMKRMTMTTDMSTARMLKMKKRMTMKTKEVKSKKFGTVSRGR